jgi:hypothetical protein
MGRLLLLACLSAALIVAVALDPVSSQTRPAPAKRPPQELLRLSVAAERPGLADPFRGITANGQIEPGLFQIRSTGVSTSPVREAPRASARRSCPNSGERP